jgi:hypothetical protein
MFNALMQNDLRWRTLTKRPSIQRNNVQWDHGYCEPVANGNIMLSYSIWVQLYTAKQGRVGFQRASILLLLWRKRRGNTGGRGGRGRFCLAIHKLSFAGFRTCLLSHSLSEAIARQCKRKYMKSGLVNVNLNKYKMWRRSGKQSDPQQTSVARRLSHGTQRLFTVPNYIRCCLN